MKYKRFGVAFWVFIAVVQMLLVLTVWSIATNSAIIHLKGEIRANQATTVEDRTSELDLIQQSDMANWAFWQLVISSGALIVSAVGLYFLWTSLAQTRKALADSERFGEAQTTAFVHAESAHWGDRGNIIIMVENSGASPVKQFKVSSKVEIVADGLVTPSISFIPRPLKTWSSLAPRQKLSVGLDPENQKDLARLSAVVGGMSLLHFEQQNVLVFGTIYYQTIFNRTYKTQFAFYVSWSDGKKFRRPTSDLLVHEDAGIMPAEEG